MPVVVSGQIQYSEVDFKDDTNSEIHRGPNDSSKYVLEVQTVERIFTLYTDDAGLSEKFTLYLNKMIELRDGILNLKAAPKSECEWANLHMFY